MGKLIETVVSKKRKINCVNDFQSQEREIKMLKEMIKEKDHHIKLQNENIKLKTSCLSLYKEHKELINDELNNLKQQVRSSKHKMKIQQCTIDIQNTKLLLLADIVKNSIHNEDVGI